MAIINNPVWPHFQILASRVAFPKEPQSLVDESHGSLTFDGIRSYEGNADNRLLLMWMTNFIGLASSNRLELDSQDDSMGLRIAKTVSSWSASGFAGPHTVLFVTLNPQLSTLNLFQDLSGSLEGAGGIGGMLARSQHSALSAQPVSAYYHADGNGNITCMVDDQNRAVARYIYDPFGNIASSQGPLAEDNLYRFSSKEFHPQSGLVYYLYRYYEPNLQRWANRDPLRDVVRVKMFFPEMCKWGIELRYDLAVLELIGDRNLYALVDSDPLTHLDAWGLAKNKGKGQKERTLSECEDDCLKWAQTQPDPAEAGANCILQCDLNPNYVPGTLCPPRLKPKPKVPTPQQLKEILDALKDWWKELHKK